MSTRTELIVSLVLTSLMAVAVITGFDRPSPAPSPEPAICEIEPGGGTTGVPFQSK